MPLVAIDMTKPSTTGEEKPSTSGVKSTGTRPTLKLTPANRSSSRKRPGRSRTKVQAYPTCCFMFPRALRPSSLAFGAGKRTSSRMIAANRKVAKSMRTMPLSAMTESNAPASRGATIRDSEAPIWVMALARPKCSRPTIMVVDALRVGHRKAVNAEPAMTAA